MAALEAVRQDVATSVQKMSTAQRLTLGLAFAATAIGLFLVSQVTGGTTMGTLYGDLEPTAAAAVVDQLEAQGIPYELAGGGRIVLVPSDRVHAVRLDLSAQGLPDGSDGWSILDNQGITSSEFDQRVGYQRAMEGELARTIAAIDGIAEANVHLALPDDDLFVADEIEASASVLLVTSGAQAVSPTQVEAIVNLVASSIEGMTPDRVSISDQTGRLLAAPGEGSGVLGLESDGQLRAQRGFEAGLEADIESLLAAIVGPGLALVNVSAELDFDSVVTVTEQYEPLDSPDGDQLLVAETTRAESYQGEGTAAVDAGELDVETPLIPDADEGTEGEGGVNYSLDERDATFAMNKVVTNAENAPGEVESLSIAVLLDETAVDAGRLAEIETLVAAAAGIDADRGDVLAVSLMPIDEGVRETIAAANGEAPAIEAAGLDLIGLLRTIGTVVIALVVLLFGLRSLRKPKADDVSVEDLDDEQAALEGADGSPALGPASEEAEEVEPPEVVLQGLLANQPDDVAGVLRSWLNEPQEVG